jgi:flagellar motility protein MotE (MotC chaperone)
MKSVLIISVVTFFLIFGGLAVLSNRLGGDGPDKRAALVPEDRPDTEVLMKGLEAERAMIRSEMDELVTLRQALAVQERVLAEGRTELAGMVGEIEAQQRILDQEQERAAVRLAKMYENMKPAQAAPILSNLEMAIILDIMQRMKEREAARILANMDAGLAAAISTELSMGGSS